MKRYESTRKASSELRHYLKYPHPSKKYSGAFSSDVDMCPLAWLWRQQRGEIRERAA